MMATNANLVAASLQVQASSVSLRVGGVVRHHGQLLLTRARAHASGRPGPQVISGDYRRSITMDMDFSEGISAVVGTNAVQGPRLEFGFNDTDSLGRVYNQPPFPHFEPAIQETEPEFVRGLGNAL